MLGPDGGFNGSVISFSFFPFICFFDLSFAFQLAACDRFFFRIFCVSVVVLPCFIFSYFSCWFLIGYFGQTRTGTFGYPKCWVSIFQSKFQLAFFENPNFKNFEIPDLNFSGNPKKRPGLVLSCLSTVENLV